MRTSLKRILTLKWYCWRWVCNYWIQVFRLASNQHGRYVQPVMVLRCKCCLPV